MASRKSLNQEIPKPRVAREAKPNRSGTKSSIQDSLLQVNCDSESIQRRLSRLESNYTLLDLMLTELESRVPDSSSSDCPDSGDPSSNISAKVGSASANPGKPR